MLLNKIKKIRKARPVVHRNREDKAKMIESILMDYTKGPIENKKVLDIGCSNGGIASYFSRRNEVTGVDIQDQRSEETKDKFDFKLVSSERLPFKDGEFDIVLSHHVIEHVEDQPLHLNEIYRVMKADGIGYIATPNKSSPIMSGHVGNDQVLRYREMSPLFEAAGFKVFEYSSKVASEPTRFNGEIQFGKYLPQSCVNLLRPVFPSHMFVIRK